MTTPLPAAADPLGGATPAEHGHTLATVLDHLTDDAARFELRPVDVGIHLEFGLCSAMLQFDGGNTAAVDALAGAYGLPAAQPGSDPALYTRSGPVTVDGQQVHVTVYCAPPPTVPVAALPAVPQTPAVDVPVSPAVDGGPLQVAAVRADTTAVQA